MQAVYVVSHAHAEHTARDLVGGWFDSQLTPHGRADAHLVAQELERRRRDVKRPLRITTSDLARAAETAQIIASTLEVPLTTDPLLREISFGEAEGRPNAWLDERNVPTPDDDRLDHRKIPGAETAREVGTRVGASVRELMADPEHDHITHGYAQKWVITTWLRIPVEAAGFASFATKPGAITHLQHDDYWRNRTVVCLADTSHLGKHA